MATNTALLIIDVQKAMFKIENTPLYQGVELLQIIGKILSKARDSKILIIYIQHNGQTGGDLEKGKTNWEIHENIKPLADEIRIEKTKPDSFYNTELLDVLRRHEIENLVITGIQTEFCVDTTCRRAAMLDYKVTLIEDGHSTFNTDTLKASQIIKHHNYILGSWFAELKKGSDFNFN